MPFLPSMFLSDFNQFCQLQPTQQEWINYKNKIHYIVWKWRIDKRKERKRKYWPQICPISACIKPERSWLWIWHCAPLSLRPYDYCLMINLCIWCSWLSVGVLYPKGDNLASMLFYSILFFMCLNITVRNLWHNVYCHRKWTWLPVIKSCIWGCLHFM